MDINAQDHLETKAGFAADAAVTHAEMLRAFEAFRETNDERLAQIERMRADVLLDEKVARINDVIDAQQRRLDDLTLKGARPALGAGHAQPHAARRHSDRRLIGSN